MEEDGKKQDVQLSSSLSEVASGTIIVFIGTLIGLLFAFFGRVLFARFFGPAEYGVFSLGLTLVTIASTIGTLGFQQGVTRQIAYFNGKKEYAKSKSIIFWSLFIGLVVGSLSSLLLFLFSDTIAITFFEMKQLSTTLKIFSFAIPFLILISILVSIFRGEKNVKPKVYFNDLLRNILFIGLLALFIVLGFSFEWGIFSYVLSLVLTGVILLFYFVLVKKGKRYFSFSKENIERVLGKELFLFSLPLLLVTILHQVMAWTDTLMLGIFASSEMVGYYNAAKPIGEFVSMALNVMLFTYTPVVSGLYSQGKQDLMKRDYVVLTKWVCSATFPLTLILVLFPGIVMNFVFGKEYIIAGGALQVLALGFFINNLMGPNGATLTAIGRTKFLMYATFGAAVINVMLNFFLIPSLEVLGASLASVIAIISINIIRSLKLYRLSKVHSIDKNIVKPIISSIVLISIIYFATRNFIQVSFWMLPVLLLVFVLVYLLMLLLTKSFDEEDISMIIVIERKLNINLKILKRIIKKFMK